MGMSQVAHIAGTTDKEIIYAWRKDEMTGLDGDDDGTLHPLTVRSADIQMQRTGGTGSYIQDIPFSMPSS